MPHEDGNNAAPRAATAPLDVWKGEAIRARILNAETDLNRKILGQERAIRDIIDNIKRAALGLSTLMDGRERPRAVLFFAGPDDVGKLEVAQALARIVFNDVGAYIKFDMGAYSKEDSAYRLMGQLSGRASMAPGAHARVGRQWPTLVITFNEVEKAHPRVFDLFLQILEDGRLTDADGLSIYFTQCIIIFNSNLGVSKMDETSGKRVLIRPDNPHEVLAATVINAIVST
jgi:ATP-dependent Clp protease ATP-binding subunit ClpA